MVHSTKGEVFDRNVDGDYKVTSPERIANIYARKQKVNTEDELFPYAKISDLRPDLIKRARQMAINNSQNTHIWANMTDELGSGVRNIVKYTKIYSGGEPTFEENDIFTTIIPLKKTINVSEKNSIEISKGQNELLNDPLNEFLDDTQNKILNLIKSDKSLTYDELSSQLNISVSTIKRKIKQMKELNIIVRINGKRDGYWKILK